MNKFSYFTKIEVQAAQWKGDNLEEMKELLSPYVGLNELGDPEVYSEEIEPYFFPRSGLSGGGYNILRFLNEEVDPGRWVVVYSDKEIETMDHDEFKKLGYRQ